MGAILSFFDRAEDRIRKRLSRRPFLYAFIGGTGVILFWRGIWNFADYLVGYHFESRSLGSVPLVWWDGPLSVLVGTLLLLPTGVFVSSFIGNEVIITGLRGEKKLTEKTEAEIRKEAEGVKEMRRAIRRLGERLESIEKGK